MNIDRRLRLEHQWHETEDFARDDNSLIVGVYASGLFDEAGAYCLNALGDLSGHHVLDYGCGTGGMTAQLLSRGARVTGFDISAIRLREARRRLVGVPGASPPRLVQCAAELLPFRDGVFDAVLGKRILHHLDLEAAIPEVARLLPPGGRAVFLEPLVHNPILEAYRRLTPHLRSPTERALSMRDLQSVAAHFSRWAHREYCLFAVMPAIAQALFGRSPLLDRLLVLFRTLDRRLVDALPCIGRYCWETVVTLQR